MSIRAFFYFDSEHEQLYIENKIKYREVCMIKFSDISIIKSYNENGIGNMSIFSHTSIF